MKTIVKALTHKVEDLEGELEIGHQKIKRLESALKFYANESNWCGSVHSIIFGDGGFIAQKALQGEKE